MGMSTALWHQWALDETEGLEDHPEPLRLLFVGGEKANGELLNTWLKRSRGTLQWLNTYGPTETTNIATTYGVSSTKGIPHGNQSVPIGMPNANIRVFILDPNLEPVPVGVSGQVCIAGLGVGRGYINQPGLTAAVYVPNPLAGPEEAGDRMYLTGDLAKHLHDGQIRFLGRLDRQVKLRGYRIELAEIEKNLCEHPEVANALAVITEAGDGQDLHAYYIPKGSAPDPVELKAFLKRRLPDYMVPAGLRELPSFPVTSDGKVDVSSLPIPDPVRTVAYTSPWTPVEEVISGIWSSVLGVAEVGAEDQFFELGGHSLKATQVIASVKRAFQIEMPIRILFENPVLNQFAKQVAIAVQEAQGVFEPSIKPVPEGLQLPLSFAQERLWFLQQLEPQSAAYNLPMVFRLRGSLDVAHFKTCCESIVNRQAVLRTRFTEIQGQPYQVIDERAHWGFRRVTMDHLPQAAREKACMEAVSEEVTAPFSLEQGPMLRVSLFTIKPDDHILVMNFHHIVSDGWSIKVFFSEFATLYGEVGPERNRPLTPLPIRYADYAYWQRQWLSGETLEAHQSFWEQQLRNAPPLIQLPTDFPRPQIQTFRGAHQNFQLSDSAGATVTTLCSGESVTQFMVFLAAYGALLARYSGQEDICIGTPVANRHREATERLIGFFVNMLVMRVDLSGNPSFLQLLRRVRRTALEAYAHQDVPFEKVVECLQPDRDLSRSPLFQVMFCFGYGGPETAKAHLKISDLEILPQEFNYGASKYDLSLHVTQEQEGYRAGFEFKTDLFREATINRFTAHFRNLFNAVMKDPAMPLSKIDLLDRDERHQLLDRFNETNLALPEATCIHQLFEDQVRRKPRAIALRFGREKMSYAQLDARANNLARILVEHGLSDDETVAMCLEGGFDQLIAILGILKAGGAYLPIHPNYPESRVRDMIADSGTNLFLTHEAMLPFDLEVTHTFFMERLPKPRSKAPLPHLTGSESGASLVYVIYTSGSTGRPKGAGISHGSLINHAKGMAHHFDLGPKDRVLPFFSFSFDCSVAGIFPPLITGATLVLQSNRYGLGTSEMLELLKKQRVTILGMSTAYWHEWTQAMARLGKTLPPTLKILFVGGEKASPAILESLGAMTVKSLTWLNTYGPTECTNITTVTRVTVDADFSLKTPTIPIGKPNPNYQIYILDLELNLVPIGIPGQLYIGGNGLARGYLRRPGLTAISFIPNPFQDSGVGERLYQTGDSVSFQSDGSLHFLGRLDRQTKIRGFRIELDEVEHALNRLPDTEGGAVAVRKDSNGRQHLVAFLVVEGELPLPGVLRGHLKQHLPDYMIPTSFTSLPNLPVTQDGKLDREALPEVEDFEMGEFISPRTISEMNLARIWESVLEIPSVGSKDNFFDLGGTSLSAVKLLALVEEQFDKKMPIISIFQHPTIEAFAAQLDSGDEPDTSPLVPIRTGADGVPWFCIHPLGGQIHWFYELGKALRHDFPVFGLQASCLADWSSCGDVVTIAQIYVEAIRKARPQGPYLLSGWSTGGTIAFEMAQQLRRAGEDVGHLLLIDTFPLPPINPENEVLLLMCLVADLAGTCELDPSEWTAILTPLPEGERYAFIFSWLSERDALPPGMSVDFLKKMFGVYLANIRAVHGYQPEIFEGDVTLIRSSDTVARLGRSQDLDLDESFGWQRFCPRPIQIGDIQGDHYSIFGKEKVARLAEFFREAGTMDQSAPASVS